MSESMPAAVFLAAARREQRDTIAVVGTSKHVGKTVMIAALLEAARREHYVVGLVSLGRDGEATDAFDDREKPRLTLYAGMLALLPRSALVPGLAVAVCDAMHVANALGELILVRALADIVCEVSGPPSGAELALALDAMRAHGATLLLVDGALDRIAPLAAVDPAFIFASGMATRTDIGGLAEHVATLIERLSLEPAHAEEAVVTVAGVLDSAALQTVLHSHERRHLLIDDPLRMTHEAYLAARRVRTIRSRKRYTVIGCCTNAYAPAASCDPLRLVRAVALATGLPTIDCIAGTVVAHA